MTDFQKGDQITVKEHICLGMSIGPFEATVREIYFGYAVVEDAEGEEWCVRWKYIEAQCQPA
ncbi:MAG TPA: hypothetical protein VIY48_02330 [Candidatus Paceibacterota bacterium]